MFEEIDKTPGQNLTGNIDNLNRPAAPTAAKPKLDDMFAGVKDLPVPADKNGRPAPAASSLAANLAAKNSSSGLLKVLIAIIILLAVIAAGLFVASRYFGFTGIESLKNIGAKKEAAPKVEEKKAAPAEEAAPATKNPVGMEGVEEDAANPAVIAPPAPAAAITATTTESKATTTVSDSDKDGLSDAEEAVSVTDPTRADTDLDGLSDGEEVLTYKTDPKKTDSDGDGLSDGDEVKKYLTNPSKLDTDGDTYDDGSEVRGGYNPRGSGKCQNPGCLP